MVESTSQLIIISTHLLFVASPFPLVLSLTPVLVSLLLTRSVIPVLFLQLMLLAVYSLSHTSNFYSTFMWVVRNEEKCTTPITSIHRGIHTSQLIYSSMNGQFSIMQIGLNLIVWQKIEQASERIKKKIESVWRGINFMHSKHLSTLIRTAFDWFCLPPRTPPNHRIATARRTPWAQISF